MTIPLRLLHGDSLFPSKLEKLRQVTTEDLIESLAPVRQGELKVRPDGIVVDGNHRIKVLMERSIKVDELKRTVVSQESLS